jgi:hypothetical protein
VEDTVADTSPVPDVVGSPESVAVRDRVPVVVIDSVELSDLDLLTEAVTDSEANAESDSVPFERVLESVSETVSDRVRVYESSWVGVGVLTRVSVFVFVTVASRVGEGVTEGAVSVGRRLMVKDSVKVDVLRVSDSWIDDVRDRSSVMLGVEVASSVCVELALSACVSVKVFVVVGDEVLDRERS